MSKRSKSTSIPTSADFVQLTGDWFPMPQGRKDVAPSESESSGSSSAQSSPRRSRSVGAIAKLKAQKEKEKEKEVIKRKELPKKKEAKKKSEKAEEGKSEGAKVEEKGEKKAGIESKSTIPVKKGKASKGEPSAKKARTEEVETPVDSGVKPADVDKGTTSRVEADSKPEMESGLNSVTFSGVAQIAVVAAAEVTDVTILNPLSEQSTLIGDHLLWDGQGNLEVGTLVQMAGVGNGARSADMYNHFDYFLEEGVMRGSHIAYVGAQAVTKVDFTGIADYTRNSLVDTKTVANSLSAVLNCRESLCRMIAPNITVSPWIFDMTSLYATGWFMFFHQMKWDRLAVNPLPASLDQAAIVFRNFHPPAGQEEARGDEIKDDMSEGRVVFLWRGLTPVDILLIMKLASGLPSLKVPEDVDFQADVLGSWDSPSVNCAVYGVPVGYVPPVNRVLTASEIRESLLKIAVLRDEKDFCVAGFIKAAEMCLPVVVSCNRPNVQRFTAGTACLQMCEVTWVQPRESNWLYRHLNILTKRFRIVVDDKEFSVLANSGSHALEELGIMVGALLSVCASTVFNDLNITGDVLTGWGTRSEDFVAANGVINSMVEVAPGKVVPIIWQAICGTLSQLTNLCVSPIIWAQGVWSSRGRHINPAVGEVGGQLWADLTDIHVPYAVSPMCVYKFFAQFAPHWMMMKPPIGFDFSSEYAGSGALEFQGWHATWGDDRYVDYSHSNIGYKYIPYGGLGLQALRWWYDRADDLPINYELIQLQPKSTKKTTTTRMMVDPPQPVLEKDLLVYLPGSVLSWDWGEVAIMGLIVSPGPGPLQQVIHIMAHGPNRIINGGFLNPHFSDTTIIGQDFAALWGNKVFPSQKNKYGANEKMDGGKAPFDPVQDVFYRH